MGFDLDDVEEGLQGKTKRHATGVPCVNGNKAWKYVNWFATHPTLQQRSAFAPGHVLQVQQKRLQNITCVAKVSHFQ